LFIRCYRVTIVNITVGSKTPCSGFGIIAIRVRWRWWFGVGVWLAGWRWWRRVDATLLWRRWVGVCVWCTHMWRRRVDAHVRLILRWRRRVDVRGGHLGSLLHWPDSCWVELRVGKGVCCHHSLRPGDRAATVIASTSRWVGVGTEAVAAGCCAVRWRRPVVGCVHRINTSDRLLRSVNQEHRRCRGRFQVPALAGLALVVLRWRRLHWNSTRGFLTSTLPRHPVGNSNDNCNDDDNDDNRCNSFVPRRCSCCRA
jgi:hypothetical protein